MIGQFDAIAFGCPSMGAEELEETEFAPMFDACEPKLRGKKVALFGSYGWGDGEWMRLWEKRCDDAGMLFACDYVISPLPRMPPLPANGPPWSVPALPA